MFSGSQSGYTLPREQRSQPCQHRKHEDIADGAVQRAAGICVNCPRRESVGEQAWDAGDHSAISVDDLRRAGVGRKQPRGAILDGPKDRRQVLLFPGRGGMAERSRTTRRAAVGKAKAIPVREMTDTPAHQSAGYSVA